MSAHEAPAKRRQALAGPTTAEVRPHCLRSWSNIGAVGPISPSWHPTAAPNCAPSFSFRCNSCMQTVASVTESCPTNRHYSVSVKLQRYRTTCETSDYCFVRAPFELLCISRPSNSAANRRSPNLKGGCREKHMLVVTSAVQQSEMNQRYTRQEATTMQREKANSLYSSLLERLT